MCDQEVGVIPKSTPIMENDNKSTREPYDPNRVYTGNKKETKEESSDEPIKEEIKVKEEPLEEKTQVVESKEEVAFEEFESPIANIEDTKKEEIKEEKEESINLYEMFGDILEVKEAPKANIQEAEFQNVELSLDNKNEEVVSEPMKEEPQIQDEPPVELVEGEDKREENVIIIDSFDFSDEEKPSLEETEEIEEEIEETEPEEEKLEQVKEPEVQEELIQEETEDKEYDVHIIENVLNYSDKQFKESVIIKMFNAEKDSRGTDLHKYSLLLDDGNIVASSRERFIIEFKEVGHCNLIMKEENYDGVKALIKKLTNESLEFIAIPGGLWKALSDQFIVKYKENRQRNTKEFITLSYVPCPGLRNPNRKNNDAKKIEEEEKMKHLQDIFGEISMEIL